MRICHNHIQRIASNSQYCARVLNAYPFYKLSNFNEPTDHTTWHNKNNQMSQWYVVYIQRTAKISLTSKMHQQSASPHHHDHTLFQQTLWSITKAYPNILDSTIKKQAYSVHTHLYPICTCAKHVPSTGVAAM